MGDELYRSILKYPADCLYPSGRYPELDQKLVKDLSKQLLTTRRPLSF